MVLLLFACAASGTNVVPKVDSAQLTMPADAVAESEPAVEIVLTPTPLSTPTDVPTQIPTSEPTQTPTPEATPVPPEVSFRVENGVVQKWTVNPVTNQEEWLPDESFPELTPESGRSQVEIERVTSDKYGLFGVYSKFYDELVAIHINGEWKPVENVDATEFIVPEFAPETLSWANPEWSTEYEILPEGAGQAYRSFWETVISQNQDYFRWLTASGNISLDNVLRAARENHDGMFPLPPEGSGVGAIRLVAPGALYGPQEVNHDPKRGAEVARAINPTGMGFLVFHPEEYKNNLALQTFLENVPKYHLLSPFGILSLQQTGIVILSDGKMVFIYGSQEYNPYVGSNPDIRTYMKEAIIAQDESKGTSDPEDIKRILSAFFQAYIRALLLESDGKRFTPLIRWYFPENDIVDGGTHGPPVELPPIAK